MGRYNFVEDNVVKYCRQCDEVIAQRRVVVCLISDADFCSQECEMEFEQVEKESWSINESWGANANTSS